jgi:predicted enzyme related to lactoylglutathione lyase
MQRMRGVKVGTIFNVLRGTACSGATSLHFGIITDKGVIMKSNPVGWFEIYVQDMARAKTFYEYVFEGALQKLDSPGMEMWAFPMQDGSAGASGALVKMDDCPSGGNSTLVYFTCADCASEAGRAASHGGQIAREKFSIGPYGYIALVIDTEGNMFGLHSMQ